MRWSLFSLKERKGSQTWHELIAQLKKQVFLNKEEQSLWILPLKPPLDLREGESQNVLKKEK